MFNVIGTSRVPKPAAIKMIRLTLNGSSASKPALVMRPDSIKPFSSSSDNVEFTVPIE